MAQFKIAAYRGRLPSYVLLGVGLAMPLLLAVHAVMASRELGEMREIYLRDHAANIAARLESMSEAEIQAANFEGLLDADPALRTIRIFKAEEPDSGNAALRSIRSGEALYLTEQLQLDGEPIFRAYVPFHSGPAVDIARIDLSASAPDFLLAHARNNLIMALVSGTVMFLLAAYAIWTTRRAAGLERRRLEMERLAELGTLSAVLAHEIRNPLGAIKGFAQLARERVEPGRTKPLDAILRETSRLENLVNALLLYGRPLDPVPRPTEWEPLAAELGVSARETIAGRAIRFTSDSEISELHTDPDLLKQALLNLIRNSVEAVGASPDAEVRLRAARAADGGVLISVEDNGPGIPEAMRAKLFSPFVTTKASGTGLGLSISRKVVETLGGTLRLIPIDPHGTRAEVALYGTNSSN